MVDIGLFRDERVELWRGWIVKGSPPTSLVAYGIQRLSELLILALRPRALAEVRIQLPLALSDDSEPEPDVAITAPGDYKKAHPSASDVHLLMEVADTSLADDRGFKAEEYARAGIPEYWIVNVKDDLVEVHTRRGRGIGLGRLAGEGLAQAREAHPTS